MVAYVDTSAALKLVFDEPESSVLEIYLDTSPHLILVSSWLLYTELHCASARRFGETYTEKVNQVLERIMLTDLKRSDLYVAAGLAGLRTNDAIHLATAIRIGADQMIAYDVELLAAAKASGIEPISPH